MTDVPIRSARRAFDVLEVLAERGGGTLDEVASWVDMPRSTAHDYLKTLETLQYAVKENNRYRASTRYLAIGIRIREGMDLYQDAQPQIESIAEETGEHASLMIEEHGMGVLLSIEVGEQSFDFGVQEGSKMPLTTCAPGKAILAHLPERRLTEILDEHGLPSVTAATITDRDELFAELADVRDKGYAIDMGERVEGVRAVSVPITTHHQVHGALTITGPTNRMTGERITGEYPELLTEAANVVEVQYAIDTQEV